jgi:hypothetical protein
LRPPPKATTRAPRVALARVTPYTKFASPGSIQAEVRKLAKLESSREVAITVTSHLAEKLPPRGVPGKPVLILVAETHNERPSLMMEIATVAGATRDDRHPTVMLENSTDLMPTLAWVAQQIRHDIRQAAGHDEAIKGLLDKSYVSSGPTQRAFLYSLADDAGCQMAACDTKDNPQSIVEREAEMIANIQRAPGEAAGEPVVVVTGTLHLAALHAALEPETTMVALTAVEDDPQRSGELIPFFRERLSYVHANADKILRLRASADLKAQPFNVSAFAESVSLPSPTSKDRR